MKKWQGSKTMNSLHVCDMEKIYLKDVLIINNLSFNPPWTIQTLENEINNKFCKYIIVKKDDIVIGYAGIWLIIDEAHITNIAIHPNYRSIGASNLLMNGIISVCKKLKVPSITLEVRSNNTPAINLYTKYGFIKEGLRKDYYGENLDGIIMWKRDIL